MDLKNLYKKYRQEMGDPWKRRSNQTIYSTQVDIFGYPVALNSNVDTILQALQISKSLFSTAPRSTDLSFRIEIIRQESTKDTGPIPENLFDYITYSGGETWLNFQFASWGNCFIDLQSDSAKAVITPEFADRPDLISRCMLNTILTNFFIGSGFGMLHASCLVKDGRVLLLMAPHGSGKSTTALNLLLSGYCLLSDSMIFINQVGGQTFMNGFPTGRIKLRRDMLPKYPQLEPYLEKEFVRGEVKYAVRLPEFLPELVLTAAVQPNLVFLCLLKLNTHPQTKITPISHKTGIQAIMENSLYYDTEDTWISNLTHINQTISPNRIYELQVGSDTDDLVRSVNQLLAEDY